MHQHRTWFPFILTGLTLALGLFLYLEVYQKPVPEQLTPVIVESGLITVTEEGYKEEVAGVLAGFSKGESASSAYNRLIDIRTPNEFKSLHLELVIAFGELKEGKKDSAEARLQTVRRQYPWLP